MTTENPEGAREPTTETPGNSQPLKSISDSSPQPKQQATESHARTVPPREPEHVYHAFEASKPELATIGNEDMIIEMKINGLLGVFYDRDAATRYPTVVYLQCDAYWNSVYNVLKYALTHLLFLREHVEIDDVDATTAYAGILADGVMINTYMKLRTVNSLNPLLLSHFCKKPEASPSFEVPLPYALAISQLGQIRASGLPQDLIYTPAMSLDNANRFGLPIQRRWSSTNYGRAVDNAKKLGMRFSYADHSVKLGSTWWLLRPSETEGRFTFECPLPEENFSTNMALLATLFCLNDADEPYNPIFNLEPLGTNNFGTMLRDPHDLIAISTFFAVEGDPSVVWTTELLKGLEATLGSPFSSDPLAPPANPVIIVISGPSGVGKDAVIKRLQEVRDGIHFVVTATSRARRPGEIDGKDYHFVSKEEFLCMIERNELLEYALVYGEYKGIPKQQIRDFMAKGYDIVLRVDVQGAATLRSVLGNSAIFIFLVAESEEVLARRLVDRKTETSDMLLVRIATAREEVKCMRDFDYVVVNAEGKLDAAVKLVESIIDVDKARVKQRSVRL